MAPFLHAEKQREDIQTESWVEKNLNYRWPIICDTHCMYWSDPHRAGDYSGVYKVKPVCFLARSYEFRKTGNILLLFYLSYTENIKYLARNDSDSRNL